MHMTNGLWFLALGLAVRVSVVASVIASVIASVDVTAAEPPALPQTISPQDVHLHYAGRWDTSTPTAPRCEWTSCTVALAGTITALNVQLAGRPGGAFQVIVDGAPTSVITLVADQQVYPVVAGLPAGQHAIALFKRTESWTGPVQLNGFQAAAGTKLTTPVIPKRRIEFLGDSITCGYGNEAASQNEHFSEATENAWLA